MKFKLQCYIIHVEQPDGALYHYVGVTTLTAQQRLARHRHDKRRQPLRSLMLSASKVTIDVIEKNADLRLERALVHTSEQFKRLMLCPTCKSAADEQTKKNPVVNAEQHHGAYLGV